MNNDQTNGDPNGDTCLASPLLFHHHELGTLDRRPRTASSSPIRTRFKWYWCGNYLSVVLEYLQFLPLLSSFKLLVLFGRLTSLYQANYGQIQLQFLILTIHPIFSKLLCILVPCLGFEHLNHDLLLAQVKPE